MNYYVSMSIDYLSRANILVAYVKDLLATK